MNPNDFLKAVCRNHADLVKQLSNLEQRNKFVLIKDDNMPIVLIGTDTRKHGRIVLEYMEQMRKKSVIVCGGGKCSFDADKNLVFNDGSTSFKTAHSEDLEIVFKGSKDPTVLCECWGDQATDKKYTFDQMRAIAL